MWLFRETYKVTRAGLLDNIVRIDQHNKTIIEIEKIKMKIGNIT